ncbi:MAG: hypothetical protein ACOVT5_05565, partial [Armatimonadaceae bacterium]
MPRIETIPADIARFEMGRRVKLFESEFQRRIDDPAARKAALGPLQAAVGGFFSGRFERVAEQLDAARFAIAGKSDPAQQWAAGLALLPERRLVTAGSKPIAGRLVAFTAAAATSVPPGTVLEIGSRRIPVERLPAVFEVSANLKPEPVRLRVAGKVVDEWRSPVQAIPNLERRLETLRRHPAGKSTRDRTIADTVAGMDFALSGKCPENEPDYGLWLERAERAARPGGQVADKPGDWRLVLDAGNGTPVRLYIPDGPERPRPLVVALHGAGGSENLYFEAYGAGRIVEMCRQRGWLLVAPRTGSALPSAVTDAVAALTPVDTKRVFLTGHSMGAMAGAMGVQAAPGRFAAVALL